MHGTMNIKFTKENVDESLRFIMALWDNISHYCKEKQGVETAKY